jgi:hypothetical protein
MSKNKIGINLFGGDHAGSVEALNRETYEDYLSLLKNMAMAIYRIDGLPTEVDQRHLKLTWLEFGLVAGHYDKELEMFVFAQATPSGELNFQNQPTSYTLYGAGGYSKRVMAHNTFNPRTKKIHHGGCIPIWYDYLHNTCIPTIKRYARLLADIHRTVEVNLMAQKTPIFIMCDDERQRLAVNNLLSGYVGNRPAIIARSQALSNNLEYISSGAPYLVNSLLVDMGKIWNQAMTFIGINNANMEKKEREISEEVESNNDQVGASRLIQLNCLRTGFNEFNNCYGTDIQVYFNNDTATTLLEGAELQPLDGMNVDIQE